MKRVQLTVVLLSAVWLVPIWGADWPAFRGPDGDGISKEQQAPLEWNKDKNIKWKVSLPRPGNGSPIVSSGNVFVTCAEDDQGLKRSLYCFDRRDGKQKWVRTVDYPEKEPTHETNPGCASTPAADGKHVVVWHGSAGLFCYDMEGKELWQKNLGEFRHMWGPGTSPVIYRDRVIMHCSPGKKNFMTAVNLANGNVIWTVEEPHQGDGNVREDKQYMGSWCTPLITRIADKDQAICAMSSRVVSYDVEDGKILWWCDGIRGSKGDLAYSSPVIAGDICICTGGFGGPGLGVKLGGTGDITSSRLWRNESNPQSIGSGVVIDGYFYRPNAGPGTIDCMDPKTGKALWTDRAGGVVNWGSIVYAGGRCYLTNQKGVTVVFKPNPEKFESLASNDLGENTNSTPAVSDGELFLRTHQNLYCVAEKSK